jgi:hypothetical protein
MKPNLIKKGILKPAIGGKASTLPNKPSVTINKDIDEIMSKEKESDGIFEREEEMKQ